jgi:hypothetical protein
MKNSIIVFLLVVSAIAQGQVSAEGFSNREQNYFRTITGLSEHLKAKPFHEITEHETPSYSKDESFYDTVITLYFSKQKIKKEIEGNPSAYAMEGKLDLLRHILHTCHYYLANVPKDSIFVRPYRLSNSKRRIADRFAQNQAHNMLELFFIIENKEVPVLAFRFDQNSARLIDVIPFSGNENNEKLKGYLKRKTDHYKSQKPREIEEID